MKVYKNVLYWENLYQKIQVCKSQCVVNMCSTEDNIKNNKLKPT